MKKYPELTLAEAIKYFIQYKDGFMSGSDNSSIKVSVAIPLRSFSSEYRENNIALGNQVSEAEKILNARGTDKREIAEIVENIKSAEASLTGNTNMKSLIIYADKNFASVVKLPVELKAETIVGDYFDTRAIYKAKQQIENYYIVLVSRHRIRLIQVVNDTLVQEFSDEDFPFLNVRYFTTEQKELAQDSFTNNLIKEFFNVADKRLQKYIAQNHFPVILAGDIKSTSYFKEVMDDSSCVIGQPSGNFDHLAAGEIVRKVYPLIETYMQNKVKGYISNIEDIQSAHLASYDLNEIYRSISSGNVNKLYLGNNLSLKGKVVDDRLIVDAPGISGSDSQELTINIIKKAEENKGNIIFVEDKLLEEYNGIVLVRRYQ